ncbi:hypothetical protein [Polyangium sp. 6x1]|uniref:hypothetical protein n=1 Tax=Polyangium sp. 6x1 TaxID=3042689 RepID=UPI00248317D0|nr:hypothetical protein [Polyangium sp. 6x1]MDI1442736.1 hypothetical protein [Polyangium sp. 6x1]
MQKQHTLNKVQWGFLVAHAWTEASFRKQLEQDPSSAIKLFAKQQFDLELEHDVALPMDLPLPPADLGIESLTMESTPAPATATGSATASGSATGTGSATAGDVHTSEKSN